MNYYQGTVFQLKIKCNSHHMYQPIETWNVFVFVCLKISSRGEPIKNKRSKLLFSVSMCDSKRANTPDWKRFDGETEEECFWHERGQCVIMMSLGVYSKTDRRRLLYRARPKGHHYQLEVSGDLSTGQTSGLTHTHIWTSAQLLAWIHPCLCISHHVTQIDSSVWPLTADGFFCYKAWWIPQYASGHLCGQMCFINERTQMDNTRIRTDTHVDWEFVLCLVAVRTPL